MVAPTIEQRGNHVAATRQRDYYDRGKLAKKFPTHAPAVFKREHEREKTFRYNPRCACLLQTEIN